MVDPFPEDGAFVRDLSRREIILRNLPMRWWGEMHHSFIVNSSRIGVTEVPKKFLVDGATIPRFIWVFLGNTDPEILMPSYWHDRAYAKQGHVRSDLSLTRDECDQELRHLMLDIGARRIKADQVYFQLKLYGKFAWNNQSSHAIKLLQS